MGKLVLFSGAGLSAESGVPTFRSTGALWADHDIDVVCNILTWKQNFEKVHEFYNARRQDLATVMPNLAHYKIAEWADRYETINLTTNVDDLLDRAGCHNVIALHGTLTRMHCTACGSTWDVGYKLWESDGRCQGGKRHCNSVKGVKPDVVFFNEENAVRYGHLMQALKGLQADDVVVVIGASGQVIPMDWWLEGRPGTHIVANPRIDPAWTGFHHRIALPATEAVEEIDAILREKLKPRLGA